ncbi:hypothetical protein [Geodermatophilus ruber]|uniref:Uncharacterized protein n=1 Tax=Geodermatophilus ruber TaxID=504800 RepID=A0A1I4F756_9ACTN|nr:hypothetical protein [Geodermatophilus ruber]SFL13808.1 hypothetical protein SAMN04488085_10717 [Geodermatophilus ruber]
MGLARRVRAVSERQLMTAAQRDVAARLGTLPPLPPRGVDRFWQQVYVPVYHRLPWKLRAAVMQAMPGSHRRTWHPPEQGSGPAV